MNSGFTARTRRSHTQENDESSILVGRTSYAAQSSLTTVQIGIRETFESNSEKPANNSQRYGQCDAHAKR
jgi:hypothetical protein